MAVRLHRISLTPALICLALAGPGPALSAKDVDSVPAVENLSVEQGVAATVVFLETTIPVPIFSCRVDDSGPDRVVLEMPYAESRLQSEYRPEVGTLRRVTVEAESNGTPGVRIMFALSGATLGAIEQVGHGLRLAFRAIRVHPAAETVTTSPDYRIGPGDKIDISVFGHEDLKGTFEVRKDGALTFPLIGDVQAAGKTLPEIDAQITETLGRDYIVAPEVSVEIRESMSRWVTIIGAVRNPARYALKADMRLIDLLAAAGGLTGEAGPEILITRTDSVTAAQQQIGVEIDSLYGRDNLEANIALQPGDIVTIGQQQVFYIRGEVNRPGPYAVTNELTLLQAIGVAGGLSQFANRRNVELLRAGADHRAERIIVNLKGIESGKEPDIMLRPNDIIIVPRRIF
jgi:polysaccharide export outer membrane protein